MSVAIQPVTISPALGWVWEANSDLPIYVPSTTTQIHVADAQFDKSIRLITLYIQIGFGTLGAILVSIWLWANRRRRSRVNAIILGLTAADMLVIGFACTMQLVWEHLDRVWLAGDVMCRVLKFAQTFAITSSVAMLLVLTIDRHQAIRAPLHRPIAVRYMTLVAFLGSALLCTPQLALFHVVKIKGEYICESIFREAPQSHRQAYLTFVNLTVFIIPTTVMLICYIRIFLKISEKVDNDKEQRRVSSTSTSKAQMASNNQTTNPKVQITGSSIIANPNNLTSDAAKLKMPGGKRGSDDSPSNGGRPSKFQLHSTHSGTLTRAKMKTLKMTVVIVTTFFICSAPYHILEMVYSFGDHRRVPHFVASIMGAMAVANSVTNPFVFLLFNLKLDRICLCTGACCKGKVRRGSSESRRQNPGRLGRTLSASRRHGLQTGAGCVTVYSEVCRDKDGRTYSKIKDDSDLELCGLELKTIEY